MQDRPRIDIDPAELPDSVSELLKGALKRPGVEVEWPNRLPPDVAATLVISQKLLDKPLADALGQPQSEIKSNGHDGWFQHFEHGSIYLNFQLGCFAIMEPIRTKWASLGWEQSFLGFPVSDTTVCPDEVGKFNHFQFGSIYWHPNEGALEVHGAIRDRWSALGWERGSLGYPTSDELFNPDELWPGGRYATFQHGFISYHPETGAHESVAGKSIYFRMDEYNCHDTRNGNLAGTAKDHVIAQIGLQIGVSEPLIRIKDLGEHDNDVVPIGLQVGPIEGNDPAKPVAMDFQLVHSDKGADIGDTLRTASAKLLQAGIAAAGKSVGDEVGKAIAGEIGGAVIDWLYGEIWADCDGMLAIGQEAGTIASFNDKVKSAPDERLIFKRNYNSYDSPMNCGAKPNYDVVYSIFVQ